MRFGFGIKAERVGRRVMCRERRGVKLRKQRERERDWDLKEALLEWKEKRERELKVD